MYFKWFPVGPLQANCYLIGCDETREVAVVDPGGDADKILRQVAADSLKVKYVINTHGHADHIAANKEVLKKTGAALLVHKDDAEMLTSSHRNLSALAGWNLAGRSADRLLQDGDVINLGSVQLEVLHTPGHTPGGISLLADGLVLTGDTLFAGGIGRTDLPGGSFTQLIESIRKKLLTLDDEIKVYPGHGPMSTIGEERASNPFL